MKAYFYYYFIVLNFLTFILMALDKVKAVYKKRRIKERLFFLLSFLGGFVGIILSGLLFNHKTTKKSFQLKTFLSSLLFAVGLYIYLYY